jgi:hypothetical protein
MGESNAGEASKDVWLGMGLVGKEIYGASGESSMVIINSKVSMSNW